MRRLLATVITAGAVVAGLVSAGLPASAAPTGLSLTGPARAGYGGTVTLTGHTVVPKSPVTVYFHRAGSSGYTARRSLTSNAAGTFSTTYTADADYRYYAVSGSNRSVPGLTSLVALSCTTTGPAFALSVLPAAPPGGVTGQAPFASLQRANGTGLWAGYTLQNDTLSLLTWSSTAHRVTVLDRLTYDDVAYDPWDEGSVRMVAVTPHGSVVAAVQPSRRGTGYLDYVGRVYADGHRYTLRSAPNWTSVRPVGISNSGLVFGEVRVGSATHGRYYVVTWAGATSPYRVVARTGSQAPFPQVDGNGDYSYVGAGSLTTIRRSSGALVATLPLGEYTDAADGSSSFYSSDGATFRTERTTVTATGLRTAVISPRLADPFVTTVSARGAVISGDSGHQLLRSAEGGLVVLPLQLGHRMNELTSNALSPGGTVAYTASDRSVHLYSCRQR